MINRNSNTSRYVTFGLLYAILIYFSYLISNSSAQAPTLVISMVLSSIFLPLILFYFIIYQPLKVSTLRFIVVGVAMLKVGMFIIPSKLQNFNSYIPLIAAVIEASILIISIVRFRIIIKNYRLLRKDNSFEEAFRGSLQIVFGYKISTVILTEFTLIRYSIFGWWLSSDILPDQRVVTSHLESSLVSLMSALIIAGLVEAFSVHILINHWNHKTAFFVTAISLYGLLFLVADLVASCKRPSYLTKNALHLRSGIRWHSVIPLNDIMSIELISNKPKKDIHTLNSSLLITPNLLLTLKKDISMQGVYGITRKVNKICLFVDERAKFIDLLELHVPLFKP